MSSEFTDILREKFENMISKSMVEMRIPGLSVSIVKDGSVVYLRGFGARNLQDNLPATPDTLYGIGSCTKSFTALAIMQLVEKGKIDALDPVSKYLPFKLGKKENPITIHHLLSMSSGIPGLGLATLIIDNATGVGEHWIPMGSFEDLMLHVNSANEEIASEPGGRYFYLNIGYTLLGEIVEKVGGMRYEQYIKDRILKPLKMDKSIFLREEFEKDNDIMTAYLTQTDDGDVKVTPSKHPFHRYIFAAGGLLSSVTELSNYLFANLNGGVLGDTRILDASTMEEMHKIQIETEMLRGSLGDYGRLGYGYGWMVVEDFLGHKLVRHGGSTRVSSAQLMFVPDLNIGVAATANVGQLPVPSLLGALALLMSKEPEKVIPDFEIERKLHMLIGKYEIYKGIDKTSVVKKGPMLYVESIIGGMRVTAPLIPESDKLEDLKFYMITGLGKRTPVEFVIGSSGNIDLYLERRRFHKI